MTKKPVEIDIVLDESGSMYNIIDDAIGGFNSFIKEQKKKASVSPKDTAPRLHSKTSWHCQLEELSR